jgi:hypothetical protein
LSELAVTDADRRQHVELKLQEIIGWEVWARKAIGCVLGDDTTPGEECRKRIEVKLAELRPWEAWAHALIDELNLSYQGKSTSGAVADKELRNDIRVLAKIGKNWRDNEAMQPGLAPKSEPEAVPLPEGQKPAVRRAWQCIHCLAYMQQDDVTAHVCAAEESYSPKYQQALTPLLLLTRIFANEIEREQVSTPPKSNSPMMPVLVKLHSMLLSACNEISRRPT